MKKKLFVNGKFYTVRGKNWPSEPAESMEVDERGIITYVGEFKDSLAHGSAVIDLNGGIVLPGFTDSHVHIPGNSLTKLFEVDLFGAQTREEIRERIRAFLDKVPETKAIFGTGVDMGITDEQGRGPCAEWIDDICGSCTAVFQSADMHSQLLNIQAMKAAGLLDPGFVYRGKGRLHRDEDGKLTGLLTDAWDIKLPEHIFSKEEIRRAVRDFEAEMLAWGYTSIMAAAPFSKGLPAELLTEIGGYDLSIRMNGSVLIRPENSQERMDQLISIRDRAQSDNLRITTAKYMIDGVLEGNTAYLKKDYCNIKGFRGKPVWQYNELVKSFQTSIKNGFQIHAHTIGDAAAEMTLEAISEAQKRENNYSLRHVLTHLQLVNKEEFEKFGKNRLIAAVQTFWHYKETGFYENVELPALGQERAERMYPVKSLMNGGAVITASGDYPVSPINNPLLGIQMGVMRTAYEEDICSMDRTRFLLNPAERVSVRDMIEAYTINGAYQLFREKETGSLEVGKRGDFILLDQDPFGTDPAEISQIRILQTYVNGKELLKP